MDFRITHRDGTILDLNSNERASVVKSAEQSNQLCGEDKVTISVLSAEQLPLQIGDKLVVAGQTYTLNQMPTVRKNGERNIETTAIFEGLQYSLIDRVFMLPIDTKGAQLMATLKSVADILVENINRGIGTGEKTFVLGAYPAITEPKNLSYDNKNCLQVLQQICEEWETEFTIVEEANNIVLNLQTAGTLFPVEFRYGVGGGIYNLQRQKGASDLITRLFVYGGTQNLTYYRNDRLCLPSKSRNASYIEAPDVLATYGIKEGVKTFDDIYPNRIGTVSSVSGLEYNEFIDSSMNFDLNEKWPNTAQGCAEWIALRGIENTQQNRNIYYNSVALKNTRYLMPNETAKIHFNTGALAGYEIDLHSYNNTTKKFVLKPLVDENGYDFPSKLNDAFKIASGDKYVILNINLPQQYKDDAEAELATKAGEYYEKISTPQAKYTLEINPLALERLVGSASAETQIFKVGDTVHVVDADTNVDASIRINSYTRNLLSMWEYKLTLSDDVVMSATVRQLIEEKQLKEIVERSPIVDINFVRRAYKTADEVYNSVFDTEGKIYGEKIQPLSIDTTMLKVGARSQQFSLQGVSLTATTTALSNTAGGLIHYTVNDNGVQTWNISAGTTSGLADAVLYIYAKCAVNGVNGVILVTDAQITFDEVAGYYHFLVGVLGTISNNARDITLTYGVSTITGEFIKTGVIKGNNNALEINLNTGDIKGNVKLTAGDSDNASIINSLIGANSSTNKYGTCSTGASTTAKVVTLTQGSLSTLTSGTTISVHFTYGNTASNPTLNVSGTGAKAIRTETGSFDTSSNWGADATIQFTYNGTYWIMSSALSANSTAQTASANASSAVTTAGQASTKAQNALDTANGIEVGGRNLLINTQSPSSSKKVCVIGDNATTSYLSDTYNNGFLKIANTSMPASGYARYAVFNGEYSPSKINPFKPGETYTLSGYVRGFVSNIPHFIGQCYVGGWGNTFSVITTPNSQSTWKYFSGQFKITSGSTSCYCEFRINSPATTGEWLEFKELKLEKGNKATDWTPAPEDVQEGIDLANLEGTCSDSRPSNPGRASCTIDCPKFKDKFIKAGTQIKVTFTNWSNIESNLVSFRVKKADNTYTSYYKVWWANGCDDSHNKPSWETGVPYILELRQYSVGGSISYYWFFLSEESIKIDNVFAEAENGTTNINGGLVLTKMLQCGEGTAQAGMAGTSSTNVAFWAGGTLVQANNGEALVVIWRNGQMKLGALALDGTATGKLSMKDANGAERFVIQNADMRLADGYRCYNNGNASNDGTKASGQTLGDTVMTTTSNSFYAIGNANTSTLGTGKLLDNCSTLARFESMDYLVEGTIYITRSSGLTSGSASFQVEIWNGRAWVVAYSKSLLYSQQPTVTDFIFPFSCVIPYTTGGTGTAYNFQSCRVVYYTSSGTASNSHFIQVSDVKYRYYQDTSKSLVQIARNGMSYWHDALNQFTVRRNNADTELTTTIKGAVDMPGVLWAGRIKADDRTRTTYYKNSELYSNNEISISAPASNTFTITHRVPNGKCSFAIVPEASAQRTFYIARNDTNGTITIYFNGAITAFNLTIFGSNT